MLAGEAFEDLLVFGGAGFSASIGWTFTVSSKLRDLFKGLAQFLTVTPLFFLFFFRTPSALVKAFAGGGDFRLGSGVFPRCRLRTTSDMAKVSQDPNYTAKPGLDLRISYVPHVHMCWMHD